MEKTTICERVDKGALCLENYISGLPDVLLVSILSLLTMKEAARTSLLSKRWRYMWTYITALNFDASHIFGLNFDDSHLLDKTLLGDGILLGNNKLEEERSLYLSWVNQVLKSYNSPSLDEFRVQFDLSECCAFDIDNWINFAIGKNVKKLALDLSYWLHIRMDCYNFPDMDHITNHTNFNSLTNLRLAQVNVTGQVLEYFLANCPFLEKLSVEKSKCLVNLKVPDLSLHLKRLEICYCDNVESIEISAINLVAFKYYGPKISFPFKNQAPVNLYIGGNYCDYLICNFLEISSYLSQLESLTLSMISCAGDSIEFAKFPVFDKLKQLELKVSASDIQSLLVFAPLIEACPFLSKFVLEMVWWGTNQRREHRNFTSRPHQYLKVVELIGFVGSTYEVEFAMYLINIAVKLEKITFDTRNQLLVETPWEFMETEEKKEAKQEAKKNANKLRTKLPAGAAFVVL